MASQNKSGGNQEQQPKVRELFKGIVKQVLGGDSLFIRSVVKKDGKYPEKQVMLSHIVAPRIGRRLQDGTIEPDQPYSFEAREFLRTKLVGKDVCFVKEGTTNSQIDVGVLYLGRDVNGENVVESILDAGLASVKEKTKYNDDEQKLLAIQQQAKDQGKGLWSTSSPPSEHVRDVKYTVDNPTNFVDSFHYKPVNAIIEYVKDGSTLRALLLPSHHIVTIQLAGLKCPGVRRNDDNKEVIEAFFEDAKFFVESKLLQRDVKVILEGVANQANGILLGTVLHPNGNISEFLLREGLARCIDWSMGVVTQGSDKYRLAEKQAKQAKANIWKDYKPANAGGDDGPKSFNGKVVEIVNGEGLVVKTQEGVFKKIFLSSIRQPRLADLKSAENGAAAVTSRPDKKNVPLYDVPYLFEAREFLRKKLVGKKVICNVDYVQPKSDEYPEKTCCTVLFGETNVAEALVSNGLAKVIRYKQDDDKRSSRYDELLAAETRAEKKELGIHSTKEKTPLKIADASSDANKAKQFLPSLQRLDRIDALVEFVASGSRFRLYLPRESCLITFLLSGIECPRLGRPQGPNNANATQNEEYSEEALSFSKERTMQHEVRIELETVDKGGNFIGWMFLPDGTNLSVGLVQAGYAAVHKTAERSSYFSVLSNAEQIAKEKRLNRWKNYVEEKPVEEVEKNEPHDRTYHPTKVVITEVRDDLHFYAQSVENGSKLEQLTTQLRSELELRPPVPGSYTPKAGELCVAKFSYDNEWYRAKVQKVDSKGVLVLYIDYGNQEYTEATKLATLPSGFSALPPQATEYAFALVQLPKDTEDIEAAVDYLRSEVQSESEFSINKEYRNGTLECVTVFDSKETDIGKVLISNGYVLYERRRERRLNKLVTEYAKAQEQAKAARRNLWKYGDITEDDATEFGFQAAAGSK